MRQETVELDALLRNAPARRRRARLLFQAVRRAGIVLQRRPLTPKERMLRERLGIQSIFPEAPIVPDRRRTP
jgi:hypothetical protein